MANKTDFVEVRTKELAIDIEGKSEVFGSADLVIKSILALIDGLDFKFIKEHIEYDLTKYYIQILDRLGGKMADESYEDFPGGNIEVVKWFLDNLQKTGDYREFLESDDDDNGVIVRTGSK